MKKLFLALALIAVRVCIAQDDPSARYASLISVADLEKDLQVIAGPDMEGRETGMPGQKKAAAYLEARFREVGLSPAPALKGYQQFFPLLKDSMLICEMVVNGKTAVYGTDYLSPVNQNENGKFKSREIVFAGYGIRDEKYDDYARLDVKGKIVMLVLGEPKADGKFIITGKDRGGEWTFPGLSRKTELARQLGASGVWVISFTQQKFAQRTIDNSKRTNSYFPGGATSKKSNHAVLSHDFARTLFGQAVIDTILEIASKNKPFLPSHYFTLKMKTEWKYEKQQSTNPASNVIGIVEGNSRKDEYVILTAHYDHLGMHEGKIYHGADDDGSGTTAILQMGKAFAQAKAGGKGPARTVVIMAVSGEEKGLWGSEYYSENPVFPLEKTSANLNIDMIGRIDTERKSDDTLNYVYVVGHDKISTELSAVNESANNRYSNMTLDYKFDDPKDPNRIYFRSDHYNFARKGVPALFFYDGMLQGDYHKPTDTVDKINWGLFQKRTKLVFHTAWEISNRDQMLKRDLPIPTMTR
jgi:hypothetical protein